MFTKVAILSCLFAAVACMPQPQYNDQPSYGQAAAPQPSYRQPESDHKGMPYNFQYDVKDDYGNDYGHRESSDGQVVTGEYRVLLPDTRVMIVTYTADHENGYQAQVNFEGTAVYPDHKAAASSYGPPQVSGYQKR